MIRILESKQVGRLFARRAARLEEAEAVVRPILDAVRKRGDPALIEYARRFDSLERRTVRVPAKELTAAAESLPADFRAAIVTASANIRAFADMQVPVSRGKQIAPGLRLGQIVRPLDSVAAYIPAGRYPLPSTLMMTVIPAQVAGVKAISVASPRSVAEVLGTAHLL
jgi:histidinol dehydrogenase